MNCVTMYCVTLDSSLTHHQLTQYDELRDDELRRCSGDLPRTVEEGMTEHTGVMITELPVFENSHFQKHWKLARYC